jgi:transposase
MLTKFLPFNVLDPPHAQPYHADQMEIARLKADLAKTRMERDILKKAAAYFARESR